MKLFGINIGKKLNEDDKSSSTSSAKAAIGRYTAFVAKHQAVIITLAVTAVLALTSLQMLHFTNPPVDDARAQENISKLKRIKIDDDIVQQIQSLQASNATASPDVDEGRVNPFSE